jgi:hypothetical protein
VAPAGAAPAGRRRLPGLALDDLGRPLLRWEVGERVGQPGAFGVVVDAQVGGQPVEGGRAAVNHLFRLHAEHCGHHVVLDLAAQREFQERPILWIGLLE